MGMFDDVIINKNNISCLTDEEKDVLLADKYKDSDNLYFQTKELDNSLYQFEILDNKIYQVKDKMNVLRPDISSYNVEIYNYFVNKDGKIVDCELNLHIKDGIIQEMVKKRFEVKEPEYFKPLFNYEYKRGYKILLFFANFFSRISCFFRRMAFKRRVLLDDE